ncbi:putative protease [Candidatus Electrothrix marina]|uniref:Putative protease n=1 Tax=Candidatus Electrothrix marina TaxID=1859130 RepID=A0A444JEM7_9BACT|nr:putative protease [Candidatus Electrothrix marina]
MTANTTDSGTTLKIPELLAPAGNMEKLITAVHYGADAVYLGGSNYSLRAGAGNFNNQDISKAVAYAHERKVKVYIALNIFAHNRDLKQFTEHLRSLRDTGADGLIVADPGILLLCKETVPDMPVHLSTQANVTNSHSVRFWASQGVRRINLARELSLREIRDIRQGTDTELEIFVHGALCISYSGRCMLSNYLTGRDANQGSCAHPCRYSYALVEEKRPGVYFPVEEDERGTYIFNSRDLCLLSRLPELVAVGVDAIKIEGRMKSMGYVGAAVRVYRAALDFIKERADQGTEVEQIVLPESFRKEINKVGTRGQTENFFNESPSADAMLYDTIRINQQYSPVGIVRASTPLLIEARNVLTTGDRIEYLGRDLQPITCTAVAMKTADGEPKERANPGDKIILTTSPALENPEINTVLRKKFARKNR